MLKEQKDEVSIQRDDVREGLVAVISVRLPQLHVRAAASCSLPEMRRATVEWLCRTNAQALTWTQLLDSTPLRSLFELAFGLPSN